MDRRCFVQSMMALGIVNPFAPRLAFARVPRDRRFVFVLLRGGLDGLAAIVPRGDPDYERQRGELAYSTEELTPLEGEFFLAPGLAPLARFRDSGELAVAHALAIPHRTRSHFDAQAVLETGLPGPRGSADGWLNRLLGVLDGEHRAVAVAAGLPRSLDGPEPVLTWSPARLGAVSDDFLDRLHALYQRDPVLLDRFEAALQLRSIEGEEDAGARGRGRVTPVLTAAADLLRRADGPNVAAVEFNGWDTHANQGRSGGPLDRLLRQLADGLVTFREAMGEAWSSTTVVVLTEFGRTARPNGTSGTDHGTAGCGFVLGAAVASQRIVHGDWPGLADRELLDGRDLRPVLDTRSVLAAVLEARYELSTTELARVFPEAGSLRPLDGLMT